MVEVKTEGAGNVKITDDVIAAIASAATVEVEGVFGHAANFAEGITGKLSRKNQSKGVVVQSEGMDLYITTDITVQSGMKIQEVSREVQQKVKTAVETMTGLNVIAVDVNVFAGTDFKRGS